MNEEGDDVPRFRVLVDGQIYGPYPKRILSEWIAVGKITASTSISDGSGPWIRAGQWLRDQAQTHAMLAQPVATPPPLPAPPVDGQVLAVPSLGAASAAPGWGVRPAAVAAPPKQAAVETGPPERDRIVVLGRRQSGKTIYLASVYGRLWRSLNGMTAKAVNGNVHRQMMETVQTLQRGEWPAATLGTTQIEMEVEHAGKKRQLVTLDFAGEMFRKAFVDEQHDFAGVKELINHIDRAAAVLLLVDPAVAAGVDFDAVTDDDFGIVQAAQRIRHWPGGEEVPIALILTKADQHQELIDRFGGAKGFVRHHFPALVRMLKQVPIFQISAVQIERRADGTVRPSADSQPINVEAPLKYCLDRIDFIQQKVELESQERERVRRERAAEREELASDKRTNRILALTVGSIMLVGLLVVIWILVFR